MGGAASMSSHGNGISVETMRTLDGGAFAAALHAGTLAVVQARDHLDRINVFPVADADTGANMAATLQAASERLRAGQPAGVGDAVRLAADGALDGARGNSGAILAQFLHGLALSLRELPRVSASEFADGALQGSEAAWTALQSPREGTILSVLRSWSEALAAYADAHHDLIEALGQALHAARRALSETPHQLAVLARNRVVDAGAQGFVFFIEGMLDSMRSGETLVAPLPDALPSRPLATGAHREVDASYRFCAEVLLAGHDLDPEQVKASMAPLGESLVVAGGGARMRIHLHTNAPQAFMDEAARFGPLEATKVDDMVLQQLAARESTIALVTDSTCDIPDALAYHLGVVRVPLKLTIDGREYRDGVDMSAAEFYRRLPAADRLPTSSQPAAAEFSDVYRRLLEHHEGIVSLHLSGELSGTVDAARRAAEEVDPDRIRVVDTHKVSVGVGLLVEAASRAVEQGAGLDDVERALLAARGSVGLFGTVSSLDQAVKGGRLSKRGAWLLRSLHLYPIIEFGPDGRALKGGAALGFEGALRQIVRRAVAFAGDGSARAMVVHTDRAEAAAAVAESLRGRLGLDEVPIVSGGPVIATHVGVGCVTVGIERL
jgi:uncharacterized protein